MFMLEWELMYRAGLSRGRFRTDGRTMATGASVTWTHYSVPFEVTWGKTAASARMCTRVRADGQRPGHGCQGTI
jgi:hypothetical protein